MILGLSYAIRLRRSTKVIHRVPGIAGITRACPRTRPVNAATTRASRTRLGDITGETFDRFGNQKSFEASVFLALPPKTEARMLATCLLRHIGGASHVSEDVATDIEYACGRPTRPEISSAAREGGCVQPLAP